MDNSALNLKFILNPKEEIECSNNPNFKEVPNYTPISSDPNILVLKERLSNSDINNDATIPFDNLNYKVPLKPKRKRANSIQTRQLEQAFRKNCFPPTLERVQLAEQIGMTPRAVQIWFQNKRQALNINRSTLVYSFSISRPEDAH